MTQSSRHPWNLDAKPAIFGTRLRLQIALPQSSISYRVLWETFVHAASATQMVRLPLFSGLHSRQIMQFSCPAAGPLSNVFQTPLG